MPSELDSTEKLFMKHSSKPYNPKLANIFFKSGMIEAWGRGFDKIKEACECYGGPLPEYQIMSSGVMVLCKACNKYLELLQNDGQQPFYHEQSGYDEQDIKDAIINYCKVPRTAKEIMQKFDLDRSQFRRHYLDDMLISGELKRTEPDKPKSRNQKYYS